MAEEKRIEWNGGGAVCSGCKERQNQIDDLKRLLTTGGGDDCGQEWYRSTFISERQQKEIDEMLLNSRQKAEFFEEAYNQAVSKEVKLAAENEKLKNQLEEKINEVALLSEQNSVFAKDFRLEREDRERAHGRLAEQEQELEMARRKIAEMEEEKQQLLMTISRTRHQEPVRRHPPLNPNVPVDRHRGSVGHTYSMLHQSPYSRQMDFGGWDVCDKRSSSF